MRFSDSGTQDRPSEWVNLIDAGRPPYPPAQPYRQLAKVLADVSDDANREVLVLMKDRQFGLGWMYWPHRLLVMPIDFVMTLFRSTIRNVIGGFIIVLILYGGRIITGPAALLGLVLLLWSKFGSAHMLSAVLLRMTIEYGYVPLLAILWSAAIIVLGWWITLVAKEAGVMVPSRDNLDDVTKRPREPLSPFLYSLNVFLPIIDLHQEKNWWPDVNMIGKYRAFEKGREIKIKGSFVRSYLWFQIMAGWLLSGFFIAGLSGLIKQT